MGTEHFNRLFHKWFDKKFCWKKIKKAPVIYIEFIPENMLTYEMCKYAVNDEPKLIFRIPVKFQTEEMWIIAAKRDWTIIEKVHPLTSDIAKAAVQTNELAIEHIDKNKYETIYEECCLLIL